MSELLKENMSYSLTNKNQNCMDYCEINLFVKE